ncbi:conserved hypothetical protein [Coccidioides posadasii str. Silveira]|uniref:Uncharacterized protein n=1 Tax=Coccidioides posadasii (strain RMSCC 757 / Silveira) TaxID=443226 RepID=E9DK24_COCPS|nr:conserved hypothetical protein [Coccidioides posadasii str. Silveira]
MPVECKQCPAIQLITYDCEDGAKTIFNEREDPCGTGAPPGLGRPSKRYIQGRRGRFKACHDMLKRIQAKHEWQNSRKEDHKMIEDKAIEELMAKQFAKGKSKELEAKVMAHGHDCLAVVSVSREGVEEEMRGFLGQLQGSSEDNNSPPAPEKMEEDDFEVVVSSDENDEEDNEMEDDWIIDA